MAKGPEMPNSQRLHNFILPSLNWANQKQLRCMKIPNNSNASTAASATNNNNNRIPIAIPVADSRSSKSQSKLSNPRNLDARRFKLPRPRFNRDNDKGIQAVREETILDLKKTADRMKDEIFGKRVSNDEEEERGDNKQEEEEEEGYPAPASAPLEEQDFRPCNLRTRRASVGSNSVSGKGLRIEERKDSNNYPLRSDNSAKERPRFSVTLSKEEIREDFIKFVGHPPPRRPKKRPRMVQKQLDWLFPGLWLTEVTANSYKVPDLGDKGKR